MQRPRRALGVVVAAAALLIHAARGVLHAHAMLIASEPPADSVVATSPRLVRLVFSEQIEPSLAHISLVALDGRVDSLRVTGDPHDVNAIVGAVATLKRGAYRVLWHVVSADGHPIGGSFVFWVGAKDGSTLPPTRVDLSPTQTTWGPTLLEAPMLPALLRALAAGSAMALAGLLLFLSWSRAEAVPGNRAARMTRWLAVATPLLLAAHLATWIVNASSPHRLTSDAIGPALASDVGRIEIWRLALSLLSLWAIALVRRPRVALAFAMLLVALTGATGHSAAISPIVATPAKSLHLLAATAWIGGLLWLLGSDHDETLRFAREASRVSSVALWASLTVAVSGLAMTFLFLASPRDLIASGYGALVLAKVAGFVALIGFGAYHRFRVLPALSTGGVQPPTFAVTLRREITLMVFVVLLGGWLAYVPPRSSRTASPPMSAPVE